MRTGANPFTDPAQVEGWLGPGPRTAAEPWLDAWLAGRLPAPDTVWCMLSPEWQTVAFR
jgi:hypothetical protein